MPEELYKGQEYYNLSKYCRDTLKKKKEKPYKPPSRKVYPENMPQIVLPEADITGGMPLHEVIYRRRTVRKFTGKAISQEMLAQLLWAIHGVSFQTDQKVNLRVVPSAGARYPIESYIMANFVEDIPQGIYHYDCGGNRLVQLDGNDRREDVYAASREKEFIRTASVVFFWSMIPERTVWSFGDRAFRYVLLDAGHIGQDFSLEAVSLGLGSVPVGAFYDDEINVILGLDGKTETIIYMSAAGYAA